MKHELLKGQLTDTLFSDLDKGHIVSDIVKGAQVGLVAVPSAMAIALGSDLSPVEGLITLAIASFVAFLIPKTNVVVMGPALLLALSTAEIREHYHLLGLAIAMLATGLMQMGLASLHLGRFFRLVPTTVVMGFTAGVGIVVGAAQLPVALGLHALDVDHVRDVVPTILNSTALIHLPSAFMALMTLLICVIGPRITQKIPFSLAAIVFAGVLNQLFQLKLATVDDVPLQSLWPTLPHTHEDALWSWTFLKSVLAFFFLSTIETLSGIRPLESKTTATRFSPDRLLATTGLTNLILSFLRAVPSGVHLERSIANFSIGSKSRWSLLGIVGVALLALGFIEAAAVHIPLTALAGVLFSKIVRLINPKAFMDLWKHQRSEAVLFVVTLVAMLAVDLWVGLQLGFLLAGLYTAYKLGCTKLDVIKTNHELWHVNAHGSMHFLSAADFDQLHKEVIEQHALQHVLFNMNSVPSLDATMADELCELDEVLKSRGGRLVISEINGMSQAFMEQYAKERAPMMAKTEIEAHHILNETKPVNVLDRLRHGVRRFENGLERFRPLFAELKEGQKPHTLYVTCCDSRIDPNLITQTSPGELFFLRNIGNRIPPAGTSEISGEAACIEYALAVLGVEEIIVCGHSNCGAINALVKGGVPDSLKGVKNWIAPAQPFVDQFPEDISLDEAAKLKTIHQLSNLRTYSIVQEKLASGQVRLHAWFFDVGTGQVQEYSESAKEWKSASMPS